MLRNEAFTLRHDRRSVARARRQIWLTLWVFLTGFMLGSLWDRGWHITHPFEDFWSPPHLFIYTMFGLTAFLIARIALAPEVRATLGPPIRLPLLRLNLPGVLVLAGGGMAVVGMAGTFDSIWHTAFGLDETAWSFPHALLGWGTLTLFFGLVACRLALAPERPLAGWTRVVIALLALPFITGVLLGPLDNNRTPEMVRRVAALPVLAAEPDFQHTTRISLAWNLTRSNPLFVPLSALAGGISLSLALALVRRGRWLLFVTLLTTLLAANRRGARFFGLEDDPRAWLPLPFFPAALTFVIARWLGLAEHWCWAAAGAVFGLLVALIWGAPPVLVLLAAPGMAAGAAGGRWLVRALTGPSHRDLIALLALAVAVPALTGCVDLALRWTTA